MLCARLEGEKSPGRAARSPGARCGRACAVPAPAWETCRCPGTEIPAGGLSVVFFYHHHYYFYEQGQQLFARHCRGGLGRRRRGAGSSALAGAGPRSPGWAPLEAIKEIVNDGNKTQLVLCFKGSWRIILLELSFEIFLYSVPSSSQLMVWAAPVWCLPFLHQFVLGSLQANPLARIFGSAAIPS